MATEFKINIDIDAHGVGRLTIAGGAGVDRESLTQAIGMAAEDALTVRGAYRIEADPAEDDHRARWALVRSGFRLEGRRRQAIETEDHRHVDELIFARLAADVIGGPDGFSAVANSTMPRKRLIAHVLMRDELGRVLLCETTFKRDWELPGGVVEPGESPRLGAIREVREELGFDLEVGGLLAVDWMPPYLGWDDALELIFDGGVVTEQEMAGYRLDPQEIRAVRLIDLAQAEPHLTPLSFRRLTAITALGNGRTLIMEDGRPL
ncbi:NUDIX hydrolase [Microlunatus elymi]|uniref:NUDIX hydrolase n=1 Tax=Microlunatus elymi TaxID=2596828 RepID=A0A516Q0N9_9ACTN|nr:NUDIX hydrolase [Microlunatus elymi]QDP97013.1 NUDIX hydrolase [Microlunatus elymi]